VGPEILKFNWSNSFELWNVKIQDMFVQQGVEKSLLGREKKPMGMDNDDWEDMDARALRVIRLCLVDDVLFNIIGEITTAGLWTKLESLYIMKC